ncbi:hypothetical protein O3M35_011989 [Rhynocoris fuscipes]|uniref:Uncharacterized protein n=1 Tax=Rhynocoris fuscipes TaxID=488301 RepID=A0AAW1CRL6_9HEMI
MQATRLGNFAATRILLKSGSNPNCKIFPSLQTPLMLACFNGSTDIVNILEKHGADWSLKDICGQNALHYAVSNSQLETLKMAMNGGCDVNSRDNYNWTPLMRAAILGASDGVLSELLEHGANIELRDEYDRTCIEMARLFNNNNFILFITKRDELQIEQDFLQDKHQT